MWHGVSNQPQAGTAADENTGAGRHGARTEHQPPSSAGQDISVPAQGSGRDTTQPGMEYGYHLHPYSTGVCVLGGSDGLVLA